MYELWVKKRKALWWEFWEEYDYYQDAEKEGNKLEDKGYVFKIEDEVEKGVA